MSTDAAEPVVPAPNVYEDGWVRIYWWAFWDGVGPVVELVFSVGGDAPADALDVVTPSVAAWMADHPGHRFDESSRSAPMPASYAMGAHEH